MALKTYICQGIDMIEGCGRILTSEERHYYETTCESCEREWGDRMDAWHHGGHDEYLDSKFSVPAQKLN